MNIYILDDEENSINLLEWQLKHFCPEDDVVGTSRNPVTAISEIKNLSPDLLLLDIQMPHINGFEVLEQLGDKAPVIIFITAYDQYAIRAIRFSALDYLLKPIDSKDLTNAIAKAKERLQEGNDQEKIVKLLESIASKNLLPGKIAIPTSEGLKFVLVNDIIHCESDNNYTNIYLSQKKKVLASRTLKEFDEMLQTHSFVRIHQSHLINLQHLDEYIKTDGGSVRMADGSELPIARNRKEDFMERLGNI